MTDEMPNEFIASVPVLVYVRPAGERAADWQEFDRGTGAFRLPEGMDVSLRVHNLGNEELAALVRAISHLRQLTFLNLSENRKIDSIGLKPLRSLPQLIELNLSSCDLSNEALEFLTPLTRLERLDISYCNRLSDNALKPLKSLPRLSYLNVQGCVKLTNAGLARIARRGLTIHR
ncbi:MAG TPA: hypothetical protein VIO36_03845 [Anaerolineaceae bacterium]